MKNQPVLTRRGFVGRTAFLAGAAAWPPLLRAQNAAQPQAGGVSFQPDGSTGVDKAAAIARRAWAGLSAGDHPQWFFAAISRG